ncbi:MAG: hypothetical protein AAFZ14_12545, partial [Pseudomonadota bacterium]
CSAMIAPVNVWDIDQRTRVANEKDGTLQEHHNRPARADPQTGIWMPSPDDHPAAAFLAFTPPCCQHVAATGSRQAGALRRAAIHA